MTAKLRSNRKNAVSLLVLLIPVMLGLFGFSYLSWAAIRKEPDTVMKIVPGPWVQHSVVSDYTMRMRSSTLYPFGSILGPSQRKYVMRLIDSGDMTVTDRINSGGATLETVEYWIDLRVRAEELWSKEYSLVPRTKMTGSQSDIITRFSIPFDRVFDDLVNIQKETSLGPPNGKYDADVIVHVITVMSGSPQTTFEVAPVISFSITTSGYVLEAPKELSAGERKSTETRIDVANTARYLGKARSVAEAKLWSAVLAGLALVALIGTVLAWFGTRKKSSDPSALPYGSLVVRASQVTNIEALLLVKVASLKDLVRIAEEAQVPVMELDRWILAGVPSGIGTENCSYFTVVNGTFYYVT